MLLENPLKVGQVSEAHCKADLGYAHARSPQKPPGPAEPKGRKILAARHAGFRFKAPGKVIFAKIGY